ncbi:MAG: hypothetical protein A2Z03_00705 [Chloroflexi bacterium RBG_16_56_8]|nr:MAG: hypothetical protein A2Z03_00705 [Chloroflexi bacterium RBG_16_56_8]
MHVDGECHCDSSALSPAKDTLGDDAYQFITPTLQGDSVSRFNLTLRYADKSFRITLSADVRFDLILARSPAHVHTPTQPRQTIIARARQRRVNFLLTSELIR